MGRSAGLGLVLAVVLCTVAQAAPAPLEPPARKRTTAARPTPSRSAPRRATPPRLAKEPSDEDLLKDLEKDVDTEPRSRKAPNASGVKGRVQRFIQSLNPNISAIATLAGAYYYDHPLEGQGNQAPLGGHDPGKTGFHLQEIEVAFQAAVDPYFRFDGFFSFSLEGVHVEEAYFTTLGIPGGFQVRAGQLYHRFGRFNTQHLHTWDFVDAQVPVVRLLGAEGLGTLAGEVSWLPGLPWYAMLSVALSGPERSHSFVGDGARRTGFHIRDPRHLLYVAHLKQFWELSDSLGMNLGLSWAGAPNHAGGYPLNYSQLFGADLFFKYRNLRTPYSEIRFTVEWYGRLMQVPEDQLFDWGLYAQALFRLSKRWWLALRYDMVEIHDSSTLIAFEFAEVSSNPDHPWPVDDQHRGSIALTWQPTHFSRIRLQYNHDWSRRLDAQGAPTGFKLAHAVILQFQGNIGAHGAHPY